MNTSPDQLVLIAEDESKLARVLVEYLVQAGLRTHVIDDGNKVIDWLRRQSPDAVLLDVMLPGRDGLELCRQIREFSAVPILMVTARVEEIDRLLGLELGADDYICKPFSPREVVARLRAVLRRTGSNPRNPGAHPADVLTLNKHALQARAGDREIQLTTVEFHLLEALYAEPGRIFTRGQLMDRIYDDRRIVSDRTVDSHIKKLRRKLLTLLPDSDLVRSVYGAGYRYEPHNTN